MSTERDELALAMRKNFSGWMGPAVSYDVADAILAAGYRKSKCPPLIEGDKPHCPDCSGIVGETGVVW